MGKSTFGTELMQQIHDGRIEHLPSAYLAEAKDSISQAIEELIEVGARIRPLVVGGEQVGWVRGVHLTERKALKRWIFDENCFIEHLLGLATTLTAEEIASLSMVELRSLSRLIREMTDSDLRLYPFLNAFVSTGTSEQLWYSRGTDVTAFRDRTIPLPDGSRMTILVPSDQARLWATLVNYRIETRRRLDASFNAVLTIRPWVGKNADPLANELKVLARQLQTDSYEPWREAVKAAIPQNFNDGWAHSEDDSIEGLQRELKGMLSNDRHEQAVATFEAQLRERAERERQQVEERISRRRAEEPDGPTFLVRSSKDVEAELQRAREARESIRIVPEEKQSSLAARLADYR